jgi:DNA mismatch repair protein MutL
MLLLPPLVKDIVRLLPDAVANQIAAGEVVQRPASVVKELIENAIDAGATEISVVTKDGGSSLIQVMDNGTGMSPNDTRMALERHATSKIAGADDLFRLSTMGFRGEALPSISSVSQMEIKTKPRADMLGTLVYAEASRVKKQESCAANDGTVISVRNLFYNVPARRKFLKSNQVENRHIIQMFERVALAFPDISFSLQLEGNELFKLEPSALRQRIAHLLGRSYHERLVPVQETSTIVNLKGFIGKPEFARKVRGEQFFFANQRYIKHPYLHTAIQEAMKGLLPEGHHPSYFIYLEVPPETLDVNIHPAKIEVKFEDERSIYAILRSAVRKALGEHSIVPPIDFDRDNAFDFPKPQGPLRLPQIQVDPAYNPFAEGGGHKSFGGRPVANTARWEQLAPCIEELPDLDTAVQPQTRIFSSENDEVENSNHRKIFQLMGRYLACTIKSGLLLIDIQRANERILFERFLMSLAQQKSCSQQTLFPETIELTPAQASAALELLHPLMLLGFDISHFGGNSFVLRGLPLETQGHNPAELLRETLDQFIENAQNPELSVQLNIAYALAKKGALRAKKNMTDEEMNELLDSLFACETPGYSPVGRPVISTLTQEELKKRFE